MPTNTTLLVRLDWGFWLLLGVVIIGLALWGFLGTERLSNIVGGSIRDSFGS